MNKKIPLWMALSVGLVFSAVVMVATLMYAAYNYGLLQSNGDTAILTKLQAIRHSVSLEFYKDVDPQKLEDATIKGFMAGLGDKYAAYYSAEETKHNVADTEGRNVGIGANFLIDPKTGYMFVERIHSGSPAEKAGFSWGDRITSIGGTEVNASNYAQLVADMKKATEPVVVGVKKADGSKVSVEILPAEYTGQSVWLEMLGSTALITITEFDDTTPDQLKAAVDKSIAAENVIFDLRGNPGGTVNSVCSCLDYLLPSGDLIVATYKGKSSKVLRTSDEAAALHKPAVVLVDGSTASSGEIFALCLRDIYKAPIVGEKTYGKGIMQTTHTFPDGSSYKYSVATITTQSRIEYHEIGIVPDITLEQTTDEKLAAAMASIVNDPVVKAALEWLADSKK